MRFSHFFIVRPIFASVISLFILIIGAIAYLALPVSQFPPITSARWSLSELPRTEMSQTSGRGAHDH